MDTTKLSQRAQEALALALKGQPATTNTVSALEQRDIWILPGFGRKTSDEIKGWAAGYGIEMPDKRGRC